MQVDDATQYTHFTHSKHVTHTTLFTDVTQLTHVTHVNQPSSCLRLLHSLRAWEYYFAFYTNTEIVKFIIILYAYYADKKISKYVT
jgi:hypothetical protein